MKNRIVAFDANPLAAPQKTGVGMYTRHLITALAKNAPSNMQFIGYYYNFLGRKKPSLPTADNISYKQIRFYPGSLVNIARRIGINIPVEFLVKKRADILLFPNFLAHPSIYKSKTLTVIHDLSYLDMPEFASDKNRQDLEKFVPLSLKYSDGVITVSEFSKRKIIDIYSYAPDKIIVTPIPPEKVIKISDNATKNTLLKFGIKNKYILYLGTLEPRKNLLNLLNAYASDKNINKNYSLVLAGKMDWKFEEIQAKIDNLKKLGLSVITCGYVTDEERAILYSETSLYVLPSHYEGFGMMLLEAMEYGVPIAASDIDVFHEVAGNAVLYFDKDSPESIASAIRRLLFDHRLQKRLMNNYTKQLEKFSWEENVKKIFTAIEKPSIK